jgi:DNA primase
MSRERTEELAGNYSPGDDVPGSGWLPVGRGWLPEVSVANLPQGKDPADFVRAEGPDGVSLVLDRAVPLVEFLLKRALEGADVSSPDGRALAVRSGIEVLRQIGDSLMRHEYALWLADRSGMDAYEVNRALETAVERAPRRRAPAGPQPQTPVALTGVHRIEHEVLRAVLAFPSLLTEGEVAPTEDSFSLPMHRSLFRLISSELSESGEIDIARIASRVQDAELRRVISELSVGMSPDDVVARDTLARLKVYGLERHIVERKSRLRSLDPDREAAAYDALFEELLELEKHKRSLQTR